ncbi:1-(5-phosphoribosyl)-5-[(5-phosphoribosylamino) methylideneamino] imidazole-4-carboxamide isomerase [Iodidimonas gelatinilytica]|uniref:1-(5-phosphoribosyl)-5-[(5-phosphoribosylamino)methylideneamino] imidazole-4-carboxamide isomerase n=1 Tax=Iodidimonas gelatinilytica TaxID=1236966 RepID=A0A5A7N0R1_9PROT|nr:1-(5-phosphoribosyl)-5-[(5-phosphoribosylamino)methylideneamino]imidazole-4-carboxamide isomerase [Iodidimonas gelatinilytica]GEQ97481.1 1-(5-phosphoribosyl)-5-[(5-phosphoribosylamino) methylideneamino] imidazole-4-carboxamide isomerase [Iodidimonas gelatinilytica]GER01617.1 1-(5-phosphoribosyl)-5-[(5-phosphoribosylamino) methylideneamino] imidazole-4-carboxamide isomerase [Iodidimonas gelatinilytica]
MNIYPAIDLKEGKAVRLLKGEMAKATVFNDDPAAQARDFVAAGCQWLHLVDLDGAFAGRSENSQAVQSILASVDVPVQLGGGLRSMDNIDHWLELGVRRVILGTVAVKTPDLVKAACKAHPGRIVVGIDARGGKVATEGWAQTSQMDAADLAKRFEDAGVEAIIFTDIDRDGMLMGVNWQAVADLADAVTIPVIASGGVRDMADVESLRLMAHKTTGRIDGMVIGRALYDGAIDLRAALEVLSVPC